MTKDTTQERWNMGYYSQLEGATIIKFKGTDPDDFGSRGFPNVRGTTCQRRTR